MPKGRCHTHTPDPTFPVARKEHYRNDIYCLARWRGTHAEEVMQMARWSAQRKRDDAWNMRNLNFRKLFIPISWTASTFARLSDGRIYASHNKTEGKPTEKIFDQKIGRDISFSFFFVSLLFSHLCWCFRRRLMRLFKWVGCEFCVHSTPSANEYNLDRCLILFGACVVI